MHCGPEGNVIDESKQSTGIVCRAKRLYMPHLLKCTKIPIKVLKECCHDENIPCPAWLTEALAKEAAGDVAAPPAAKRRGVEALVVRVPQALQERIERKMIRWIACSAVPFRSVCTISYPEFGEMMHLLNPGFRVPARRTVSGRLLLQEYTAGAHVVVGYIKEHCAMGLTVLIDVWKDKHVAFGNADKVVVLLTVNETGEDIFLRMIELPGTSHAGKDVCAPVIKFFDDFRKLYGLDCLAYTTGSLTDNTASAQIAMEEIVAAIEKEAGAGVPRQAPRPGLAPALHQPRR